MQTILLCVESLFVSVSVQYLETVEEKFWGKWMKAFAKIDPCGICETMTTNLLTVYGFILVAMMSFGVLAWRLLQVPLLVEGQHILPFTL